MEDKKIALLIDSDNVSHKYIDGILNELAQYGIVTYMSPEEDVVRVLTAENTEQSFTLEQFIAATRLKDKKNLPFQVRAGLLFGAWARNTAIFVK